MKKTIISSFIMMAAILLAGCDQQQKESQIKQTKPIPLNQELVQPLVSESSQGVPNNFKSYSNIKSEYIVNIPKDWTYKEQLPTPFIATQFFDASDKKRQLLFIDRFETSEQANKEVKKDLVIWAKQNVVRKSDDSRIIGCEDGKILLLKTFQDNYPVVLVDCLKKNTSSYFIFTQNRHYLIEAPLDYKNKNSDMYDTIYKSFKIQ